jgi:hypothetical protein
MPRETPRSFAPRDAAPRGSFPRWGFFPRGRGALARAASARLDGTADAQRPGMHNSTIGKRLLIYAVFAALGFAGCGLIRAPPPEDARPSARNVLCNDPAANPRGGCEQWRRNP